MHLEEYCTHPSMSYLLLTGIYKSENKDGKTLPSAVSVQNTFVVNNTSAPL